MFYTQKYNGMYINGRANGTCYISDDFNTFGSKEFKSHRAAQIAITKARNNGAGESR